MLLLALLPVLLWHRSLGPFSFCKNGLLQLGSLALIALGAGAAWCCPWQRLHALGLRLVREPLVVAVLLGLVSATVSTVFSTCPGASWRGSSDDRNGLAQVLCLGVCFFACRLGWGREEMPTGFAAALIGLGLTGGYALAQVLGVDPLPWVDESIYGQRIRPTGAVGHTNALAALVVLSMPLLVYVVARTWGEAGSRGRTIRLLGGGAMGLVALGLLLLTLSRAGWLGLAAVIVVLLLLWPGARRKRAMACLAVLGVGLLVCVAVCAFVPSVGDAVGRRLFHLGESSSRREVWSTALRVFAEYPWTGCGLDTFGMAFLRFRTPEYWRLEWGLVAEQAHNEFLHALATQGAVGAAAYVGLRVAVVWSLVRAWRASVPLFPVLRGAGLGVTGSSPGTCSTSLTPDPSPPEYRGRGEEDQRRLVAALAACLVGYVVLHLFGFATCPIAFVHLCYLGWLARLAADDRPEAVDLDARHFSLYPFVGIGCGVLAVNFLLWSEQPWTTWLPVAGLIALGGMLGASGGGVRIALPGKGKLVAGVVGLLLAVVCGQGIVGPVLASWHASCADSFLVSAPDQAVGSLETAVWLAPREARIHAARAKGLQDLTQQPEMASRRVDLLRGAVAASEEACRLEPLYAPHHANRGRIFGDAARAGVTTPDAAFAAFDRALELDPNDTRCLADAGRAAVSLGLPDRGTPYLERGLSLDADLACLYAEMGGIALLRREVARAEGLLETALAKDWHGDVPRRERSRCLLALAKVEKGDLYAALALIEAALVIIPDFPPALWLYASTIERLDNPEAALNVYRSLLSRQPDHPAGLAAVRRLETSRKR
jgi:O-antigen ligase/tetratricopeptide (TPR) repeat protein